MDLQQQRTALRVQLLHMSRLSQRALDYSVKGYRFGNAEFSRHTGSVERELKERYCEIKHLCRQLIAAGAAAPSDFRFSLAALRLNSAFYKTYKAAVRIAKVTALHLERNTIAKSAALDKFGELANCFVRLCTIALFLNDAGPAETVLQNQGVWRRGELIFDSSRSAAETWIEDRDAFTLAITQNLCVVAKQAHEMADAIMFWLRGRDCALSFEADGHHALECLIPKSGIVNRIGMENSYQPACS
jgi:hypothetical protein